MVHRALFIYSSNRLQAELDKIRSILIANGYPVILLHLHFPRRSDNSTSHLNMDPRNGRFISIFHGWERFQPNFKSKLLQPLSVATLLLKHVLYLQPLFLQRVVLQTLLTSSSQNQEEFTTCPSPQ